MVLLFIVQTDSKEFGLCVEVGAEGDEEVKMALQGPAGGPPVQGPVQPLSLQRGVHGVG